MTRVGGWGPIDRAERRPRRATMAAVGAVVALLALVALPARAEAHAELLSTTPSAGEQLASSPDAVVLDFSEAIAIADDTLEVLDASGERLDLPTAEHPDGVRTSVAVPLPDLDDGAYVVAWRVVSSDSHPIGGAFTFRVGNAGGAPVDDEALIDEVLGGARDGDAALGATYGVVRFAAFAGVTVLVGALVFLTWLWPAGRDDRRAGRVVAAAWWTAVVATALCIPLQGAYARGGTLGDVLDPGVVADELGARTGRAWLVRLVLLVALALLAPVLRRQGDALRRAVVAAGGLALLVTVSVTGHAVSGDLVALAFGADVVHLAGVSVWLGGLAVMVFALLARPGAVDQHAADLGTADPGVADPGTADPGTADPGAADRDEAQALGPEPAPATISDAEAVVERFSAVAFGAVVAIVVSGTIQGWRQVGGYDALLETTYGRLLVLKVALFSGMLVAAAVSRSWVRRRAAARVAAPVLSPGPGAAAASPDQERSRLSVLRRSVAAEVGLAVAVLAVTALLVNAVPGESSTDGGGGGPFSTQVTEEGIVLSLEVVPAAVGPADIHLNLNEPDGTPVDAEEVRLDLALAERDLGPITVPLVDFGQGHHSADGAEFPFGGEWDVEVVVRTSDIDQTVFDVVVPVPVP